MKCGTKIGEKSEKSLVNWTIYQKVLAETPYF